MNMRQRQILQQLADESGYSVEEILGRERTQPLVVLRIEAARRLRTLGYSMPTIGKVLGRDHSTITYYLGKIRKRQPSPVLKGLLDQFKEPPRPHEDRTVRAIPVAAPIRRQIGDQRFAPPPKVEEPPRPRRLIPYAGAERAR